jgi:hypothetical protein
LQEIEINSGFPEDFLGKKDFRFKNKGFCPEKRQSKFFCAAFGRAFFVVVVRIVSFA